MDLDDLLPRLSIRKEEGKFPIKPAGSSECRINVFYPIGGSNDDNLPAVVQPVHEGEKSADDAGVDLVLPRASDRSEAVYLVEEYGA